MILASKREQILKSLNDKEYRDQFVEEGINVGIAFQIRALRNRQELTQGALADLLGGRNKQSLVSLWENPNYGKHTLATLKELAKTFDVGLSIRFVPYSTLVDQAVNLSNNAIAPPSFKEEEQYKATMESLRKIADEQKIKVPDANNMVDINNLIPSVLQSA